MSQLELERAAEAVRRAEALLIGAGAGMSVDAGIAAYRLNPDAGTPLPGMSPLLFTSSPELAWGRAGRQLELFRSTQPHRGYEILLEWSRRVAMGSFVVTSNVDGMFLAAGFPEERILEGHGSAHFIQCTTPCSPRLWRASDFAVRLDPASEFALDPLPRCPECRGTTRPNVFMFGDRYFVPDRAEEQGRRLDAWLETVRGRRVAVIECGAGTAVPTIRQKCEAYARERSAPLIRVNVAESQAEGVIRLPLRARDALERIDALATGPTLRS